MFRIENQFHKKQNPALIPCPISFMGDKFYLPRSQKQHYISGTKNWQGPFLYHLNYSPILTKIIAEFENWSGLPLLLFGRCHLFKMVSFPKLLYQLQTIPLLMKHIDLQKLQKAINTFIWWGLRPRISIQKLCFPKHEGGVNLPNICLYNLSCLLRAGLDWLIKTSRYSSWKLKC